MIKEKFKSNKGITLVSLVVTIVIMLMLTTISVSVPYNRFKVNNMNKMLNDLELLRDKVSNYYFRYSSLPILRDAENNPIIYSYKELECAPNPNDDEKYYIIDLQAMEGITLNYGLKGFNNPNTSDDVYIINERTHNIYYPRGIEAEGEKYYYIANKTETGDVIHYSKPEIKIISGEKNSEGVYTTEVSMEFVPGVGTASGAEKTTYSINGSEEKEISTLTNNILTIFEDGIYSIKVKKYDKDNNILGHTTININIQNEERKNRFITNWNVTLGETEGSQTYSTVVLPVNKSSSYDATIYWGDGTRTVLQHKTNGVTLTDAELKEKVTHNYTLTENDNAQRTIEIEGTYADFRMGNSNSTPTKLKLTQIEQWGNSVVTNINFSNCTNLSGIIPKNDLKQLNCTDYCFNQTNITGLEEGFCFSGGIFTRAFRYCYELKTIPNSFIIPEGTTSVYSMFEKCYSLESLPNNFCLPNSLENAGQLFYNCNNLKEIPESFKIPESTTSVSSLFAGCSNLEKIPSEFSLPEGITGAGVANLFNGCGKLTEIPDDFVLPDGVTTIQGMFGSCGIKKLPSNFKIPYGVTNMINTFQNCKFEEFPENFEIPETVTNMNNAIRGCTYLKGTITIKANATEYTACFGYGTAKLSGSTLTVNYSKNCTNIDAILATGDSRYVVKGNQID